MNTEIENKPENVELEDISVDNKLFRAIFITKEKSLSYQDLSGIGWLLYGESLQSDPEYKDLYFAAMNLIAEQVAFLQKNNYTVESELTLCKENVNDKIGVQIIIKPAKTRNLKEQIKKAFREFRRVIIDRMD